MRGRAAILLAAAGLAWNARAANLPVFDQDFSCTTQAKADQYVADFKVDLNSFGGMELCNPKVDTKKLLNDFELIERGQFNNEQKNLFVRDFVPRDNYYQWMKSETSGMQRGNDLPYATAYNSGGYFTMQDGWSKLSTLGRVGTIIHEARHSEGYGHTECSHGPYENSGVSGCDDSVEEGGAHAIEMEYYARVAQDGANFHPVYQSMARLMLLARANFVFNQDPMSETDGLLALTDRGLVRVNSTASGTLALAASLPSGTRLKRTSFGATLLDLPGNAWAIDLDVANPQAQMDDDYSYFKLLKMTPPANLSDMEEFDYGTQRYIFAGDKGGNIFSYVFPDGRWSSPSAVAGFAGFATVAPDGQPGIFARLSGAVYCALDLKNRSCAGQPKSWPSGVKNLVLYRRQLLSLGDDGQVRAQDGSAFAPLAGLKVQDLISVPQYDVFE